MEKQLASKRKKNEENNKLHEKLEQVHSNSNNPQLWNINELKTVVSWFKQPEDSKLPTTQAKLLERYLLT